MARTETGLQVPIPLSELNRMDRAAFVATLGHVFEASPWVAEAAWRSRPFADREALHRAMREAVATADEARQVALIRAHPDLAGRAARAGALTAESAREQAGAGLDRLSDAEFREFERLNRRYLETFGFPFVIAVRGHDKHSILAAYAERVQNGAAAERRRALEEIGRIAGLRLHDLVTEA